MKSGIGRLTALAEQLRKVDLDGLITGHYDDAMTDTTIKHMDQLRAQQRQELRRILNESQPGRFIPEALVEELIEWYDRQPMGFITLHMDHGKEVDLNVRDIVHYAPTYSDSLDAPGSSLTWQLMEDGQRWTRRGTVRETCNEIRTLIQEAHT